MGIARIKDLWQAKALLSVFVTFGFTGIYVLLQRFPLFPVTTMTVTGLDRVIPFLPNMVPVYESLWLLLSGSFWLLRTHDDMNRYTRTFLLIAAVGFTFFLFFPTSVPRPHAPEAGLGYATLARLDTELNAFPSLHVALAVFGGLFCGGTIRTSSRNRLLAFALWTWVAGIALSTLVLKQHVFIDVLAGGLLGGAGYYLAGRPKTPAPANPA